MPKRLFAVLLAAMTLLGTTKIAAQGRGSVAVSARVLDIGPSRQSLEVATDLALKAQEGDGLTMAGISGATPQGMVTVRPDSCFEDGCAPGLVATIIQW